MQSQNGMQYKIIAPAFETDEIVLPQLDIEASKPDQNESELSTGALLHNDRTVEEIITDCEAGSSNRSNNDALMSLAIIAALLSILSITGFIFFYLKKKNGK